MWDAVFIAIGLAAALGLGLKLVTDYTSLRNLTLTPLSISWREYVVVTAVMAALCGLVLAPISAHVAKASKLNRQQYLNTVEVQTYSTKTTCYGGRAGSDASAGQSNCRWTYVSGSYIYTETYPCPTEKDPGKTCTRYLPANIYTPYATAEYNYYIRNGFGVGKKPKPYGVYTVATDLLDANPQPYSHRGIPGNIPRGAPAFWTDAKHRLDTGDPRPVTVIDDYDNYVIAADNDLLKEYGGDIKDYQSRHLLPVHTKDLGKQDAKQPLYNTSKLTFLNKDGEYTPIDNDRWQESLAGFNAALGMTLQGDMHVVVIDANLISSPVQYTTALKAYWMSKDMGKRQIAKNGVVVVLGAENGTVKWAHATTGMPFGNETMLRAFELRLPGTALDPDKLFGNPITTIDESKKASVRHGLSPGAIEQIVFTDFPFKRACMMCKDKEDAGQTGYTFLEAQIQPSKAAKVWMVSIAAFIALILWFIAAYLPLWRSASEIQDEAPSYRNRPRSRSYF